MLEIMVTSSLLITVLVLLRLLWRRKISCRLQYALWILVALRLLVPVTIFENPFNIMNFLQSAAEGKELSGDGLAGIGKVIYNGSRAEEKSRKDSLVQAEPDNGQAEPDNGQAEPDNGRERVGNILAGLRNALVGSDSASPVDFGQRILVEGPEESEAAGRKADSEASLQPAKETGAAGGALSLKAQKSILEGGSVLARFFTRGIWRYAWYGGMAVLGLWIIGCNLLFRRQISKERTALGREGGLMVYLAEGLGTPCLLGVLRPAVYLTHESLKNQRHREHAVLHELTHYRHGDHIWAFVRSLCLVIYWFHPLVWLAVYLSAKDCEMACDEGMVRRLGETHRQDYGCTLIEMAASGNQGIGILHCATSFSVRKREMRDRISRIAAGKKRMGVLAILLVAACGILLAACTFGGAKEEERLGRYVETSMDIFGNSRECWGLAQDGSRIRLIVSGGMDRMLEEGSEAFAMMEAEDMPLGGFELTGRYPLYVAGSINGARAFMQFDGSGEDMDICSYLITETGEEIRLDALGDHSVRFFYNQGYFWVYEYLEEMARCYKLDPGTGEMQLLAEGAYYAYFMTANEKLLYLASSVGVQLFDLEKGALSTEQDSVLSGFVAEKYSYSEQFPTMLYPWRDGVYILTHQGLYWHKLHDETVELVIDGGYCSMGAAGKQFVGMAIRETEEAPEFFILYNEGTLMRYTYDASLPAVPDALRVYSVYEDSQISKAVNDFRIQHPDIPVVYEVGMNALYGAAVDDVLKNLATEIAAGNGPDILVMDDIPFDAYVEKGVLADLSALRETMTPETYFVNVVDAFARDEKLYAIPMTFAVPVLAGQEETLEGVESLADLADLLEEQRKGSEADYVFCTWDAESTLRLLAQSSQGAWLQDGVLNQEAVEEFLTQAKRIYDIQFSVNGEPEYGIYSLQKHNLVSPDLWIGDYRHYPLARRFDSDGLYCMMDTAKWSYENTTCYAGFLSGGERDYLMLQTILSDHKDIYVQMPGQQYGTCLASSLLAVSAGTERREESLLFLEYAISCGFLSEEALNGTPISREAYLAKQGTLWQPKVEGDSVYGYLRVTTASGKEFEYDLCVPEAEDYEKLTKLLDGVTGVNICDTVVYETVVEYGRAALAGEMGIQEAVEAIEKRVKIYLAE